MEIIRGENFEEAIINACEGLQECFLMNKKRPVLFLSSGGSALQILNQIDTQTCPKDLTISVLDERFGVKKEETNFWQLEQTDFFKQLMVCGAEYIKPLSSPGETIEETARDFARKLIAWRSNNSNGVVIITLGVGADGHTAGIMSYPSNSKQFNALFMADEMWIRGYDATPARNEYPKRVTTTIPFFREWVDDAVVFVTGKEKRGAMEKIMSEEGELNITPARVIREMNMVRIFTDIDLGV